MIGLTRSSGMAATINFDDATPDAPPPGWTATKTGKGEAKWTIAKDDTAPSKPNVLKQSGEATYPVCLRTDLHRIWNGRRVDEGRQRDALR
jgi:hypothetical protein